MSWFFNDGHQCKKCFMLIRYDSFWVLSGLSWSSGTFNLINFVSTAPVIRKRRELKNEISHRMENKSDNNLPSLSSCEVLNYRTSNNAEKLTQNAMSTHIEEEKVNDLINVDNSPNQVSLSNCLKTCRSLHINDNLPFHLMALDLGCTAGLHKFFREKTHYLTSALCNNKSDCNICPNNIPNIKTVMVNRGISFQVKMFDKRFSHSFADSIKNTIYTDKAHRCRISTRRCTSADVRGPDIFRFKPVVTPPVSQQKDVSRNITIAGLSCNKPSVCSSNPLNLSSAFVSLEHNHERKQYKAHCANAKPTTCSSKSDEICRNIGVMKYSVSSCSNVNNDILCANSQTISMSNGRTENQHTVNCITPCHSQSCLQQVSGVLTSDEFQDYLSNFSIHHMREDNKFAFTPLSNVFDFVNPSIPRHISSRRCSELQNTCQHSIKPYVSSWSEVYPVLPQNAMIPESSDLRRNKKIEVMMAAAASISDGFSVLYNHNGWNSLSQHDRHQLLHHGWIAILLWGLNFRRRMPVLC